MKSILAVTLAMMALVSVAMADGPDLPPPAKDSVPKVSLYLLADGPDLPPPPPLKGMTAGGGFLAA